jgi:hypothetical protein
MSIEELKLILSTINQVSSDASTAAIVWLVMHYGIQLIEALCWFGGAVLACWFIGKGIVNANRWADLGRQVSRAYGARGDDYLYESDFVAIDKAIAAAKGGHK